jgi:hypothetical protein
MAGEIGAASGSREPNPHAVSALPGFDPGETAGRLLREMDWRSRFVPSIFAGELPFRILLDLYRNPGQRVSSVCYGTGFPYTTSLTHLASLTSAELVERKSCEDRRCGIVSLTAWGRDQVGDYLGTVASERAAA